MPKGLNGPKVISLCTAFDNLPASCLNSSEHSFIRLLNIGLRFPKARVKLCVENALNRNLEICELSVN